MSIIGEENRKKLIVTKGVSSRWETSRVSKKISKNCDFTYKILDTKNSESQKLQ